MAARLPSVIVDMNCFFQDESFAGLINKLTLPKIAVKMAEKAMSGTAGTVERSLGRLEKLEGDITIEAFHPKVLEMPGSNDSRSELFIVKGALDQDGTIADLVVRFSGFWKDVELGEVNPEKEMEVKSSIAIEHFELEIDGKELIYIDKLTNVWRMNGKDRTKEIRRALGQ